MNLTSKRMLQCLTVVAGVFAFTATAADPIRWVEDSFENGDGGTNEMAIAHYKATPDGGGSSNYLWAADAEDQSKITTNDSARAGYSGTYEPINGGAGELVLALETDGKILTRHVMDGSTTGKTFSASDVYVDTLIKFTPSEDPPAISNDVKVAVYVNVDTNLVVWHKVDTGNDPIHSVFTNRFISPDTWNRLTIKLGYLGASYCSIYLNGELLTHTNAAGEADDMFLTVDTGTSLSAVAFQGTGFVDELVVADAVEGVGSAAILLTLSWDTGIESVMTNSAAVANDGTVPTATEITITAKDWYTVATVGGNFTGTTGGKTATGTVTGANGANVTITSATYTGTGSMGGNSVDAAKLSVWAIANSKSESDVAANAADWFDEYLLNLPSADGVTNTISIASITVGATDATIKVVASSTAVNFETINGTLNIYTATNLVTGFNEQPVEYGLNLKEQNTNTVTVPLNAGSFIKATIK